MYFTLILNMRCENSSVRWEVQHKDDYLGRKEFYAYVICPWYVWLFFLNFFMKNMTWGTVVQQVILIKFN